MTQAERRERKRLAQVLHDDIQQLLVAVKMQAGLAIAQPEPADHLGEMARLADEAISSCRALVYGLSPPMLQYANMYEILQGLCKHMGQQHNLNADVTLLDPPPPIGEDVRALLYEITRELLFNVVKHSGVNEATVMLGTDNGMVCIDVVDKGNGCDIELLELAGPDGFGLFSIRERLAVLGGRLDASASIGTGCSIRVVAPSEPVNRGPVQVVSPRERGLIEPNKKLRVLIADDHQILRQGLAKLLATQPDTEIVGQASDGVEAVEMTRRLKPDVIVMDVSMPRMTGIEATRCIHAESPEIRIVGLSMHEPDEMAALMREAGACAYVNKTGPIEELLRVLRDSAG